MIPDLVRVVAALSPRGEWVTAREIARGLRVPLREITAALAAAVRRRELDEEHDEWDIWWLRSSSRSAATPTPRAAESIPGITRGGHRVQESATEPRKPIPPPPPRRVVH